MEKHTDTYYVERTQAGDMACFACLLDKYSRPIHSLICRIVRSREDAEELTQDVFVKAYRHLDSFKGDSNFSTWLYRIAYNTAISETRKKRQEILSIEESQIGNVSEEAVAEALGYLSNTEQIEKLETALAALPAEERALILLFYMENRPVEEVAKISGLSSSNTKVKLFRIRKKLYVLLTKMEEK